MKKQTFTIHLYCKNCGNADDYEFEVGTEIHRAPYLGYKDAKSWAIAPDGNRQTIVCKFCKIGNVA